MSNRRTSQFKHYNPKRWHPEFDLIVIESVGGKSNEEIGKLFGYTKEHVSNILSTPQAQEIKDRIRDSINKEFDSQLGQRMSNIGSKAIKKIEAFIEDENNLASKSPFMFVDRALKIASFAGQSMEKAPVMNINNNGNIVISNDRADAMMKAMDSSKELDEVDYEVISSTPVNNREPLKVIPAENKRVS